MRIQEQMWPEPELLPTPVPLPEIEDEFNIEEFGMLEVETQEIHILNLKDIGEMLDWLNGTFENSKIIVR